MSHYPDATRTWVLTVGGVDVTRAVVKDTLRLEDSAGMGVDTLTVTVDDRLGSLSISPMMAVSFAAGGDSAFGGYVQSVRAIPNGAWEGNYYRVEAVSWHDLLRKTEAEDANYIDMSAGDILAAIIDDAGITGFDTATYVDAGPTLESFAVRNTNVGDALQTLEAQTGYIMRLTPDMAFVFKSETSPPAAAFAVADMGQSTYIEAGDTYPLEKEGFSYQKQMRDFFNRVIVYIGDGASVEVTDTWDGDASTYIFPTSYRPIQDVINVYVDGVALRHGTKGYDTIGLENIQCVIDYAGGGVWFGPGEPPGSGTDNVSITYRYMEKLAVVATDAGGYALAGNRWITRRIRNNNIITAEQAQRVAATLLAQYAGSFPEVVEFGVRRFGLHPGEAIDVLTPAGVDGAGEYIIRSVRLEWHVTGQYVLSRVVAGTAERTLADFLNQSQRPALEQPVTPRANSGIGIQRVSGHIEALEPGTTFSWT